MRHRYLHCKAFSKVPIVPPSPMKIPRNEITNCTDSLDVFVRRTIETNWHNFYAIHNRITLPQPLDGGSCQLSIQSISVLVTAFHRYRMVRVVDTSDNDLSKLNENLQPAGWMERTARRDERLRKYS